MEKIYTSMHRIQMKHELFLNQRPSIEEYEFEDFRQFKFLILRIFTDTKTTHRTASLQAAFVNFGRDLQWTF